jgi:histidinol dehydrogenase
MSIRIVEFRDFRQDPAQGVPPQVAEAAASIIKGVREGGDRALLDYTEKFDGIRMDRQDLSIGKEDLKSAYKSLPPELMRALVSSAGRIRRFQELQLPREFSAEMAPGVEVGVKFDPLQSVGVYIPGGRAAYPSTVLMTVIPARVAGVGSVTLFTPPDRSGNIPATVKAAAHLAGVESIYKAGGAQAIAAMAYGTESVGKVEKIVGPGNIYVTAAKMLVSWDVAVDMPAGPSEVLIYAEEDAIGIADRIALDILAQAEHDPLAKAMLVTPSRELAHRVKDALEILMVQAPRKEILERSIPNAAAVIVKDRSEGIDAINNAAPEHLEIIGLGAGDVMKGVRNAGAVFLGEFSPVAVGDYSAGTNHVLPTMGWARRASPLSTRDFLRAREWVKCTRDGLRTVGKDAIAMAKAEGLLNHARSVEARLEAD